MFLSYVLEYVEPVYTYMYINISTYMHIYIYILGMYIGRSMYMYILYSAIAWIFTYRTSIVHSLDYADPDYVHNIYCVVYMICICLYTHIDIFKYN